MADQPPVSSSAPSSSVVPADDPDALRGLLTRSRRVAAVWGLAAVLLALNLPGLFIRLKGGGFEDPEARAWQVQHIIEDRFDGGAADLVILVDSNDGAGGIDDIEVTTALVTIVAELERDPQVRSVLSPLDGVDLLRSPDGKNAAIVVAMKGGDEDKMPRLPALTQQFKDACGEVCTIRVSGVQATNVAVSTVIAEDLVRAELMALPLTLLALFFVFRGLAAAVIPVIIAALSTTISMGVLSVLSRISDVSIFAANIVTLLAMGLAIDSSLFLVTRYREERRHHDVVTSVRRTRQTTGRAVLFSGVVVAASLAGLFAFPQVLITSMGIAGLLTAAVTTGLAVTLTPALLALVHHRLRPAQVGETDDDVEKTRLYRLAKFVMKHPAVVAVVAIIGLLSMAVPFKDFEGTIPDWRLLPAEDATRIACATLDERFTPNLMAPHEIVIQLQGPVLPDDDDATLGKNLEGLAAVSSALSARDDVAHVLSPLSLVKSQTPQQMAERLKDGTLRNSPDLKRALNAFVDGDLYRLTVYPKKTPTDPATMHAVTTFEATVRDAVKGDTGASLAIQRVDVAGVAAVIVALKERVHERVPLMILVVALVMGVVLGAAFRSVIVPIKAMVLNALSLTASFGAVVFVFQDGYGAWLLQFEPTGTSELLLPVMLFALCFGLSMDYEVILLARVREEVQRGHDDGEAVARGLGLTGRSIGSAAVLFCIVVGAFATGRILSMKALGTGLALAVILDATIVRGLLAPAAMVLLGKRNWWPSDPRTEKPSKH